MVGAQFLGVTLLAAFFAWVAFKVYAMKASRARATVFFGVVSGLLSALALALVVAGVLGLARWTSAPSFPALAEVSAARAGPSGVERGRRLAELCVGCHSADGALPLTGGGHNFLEGLGTVVAPNLTPAGPLSTWTDAEIELSIRYGMHPSGRPLLIMPSEQYRALSPTDMASLIQYLRSSPAAGDFTPSTRLNLMGLALLGIGVLPSGEPPDQGEVAPSTATREDPGAYLIRISGCAACHGEDLRGGAGGFTPAGPALVEGEAATWSLEAFKRALREGISPTTEQQLDPQQMPWPSYAAAFTDREFCQMYVHLQRMGTAHRRSGPGQPDDTDRGEMRRC